MLLIGSNEGRLFGEQTAGNRDEASLLPLRPTRRLKWPSWLILEPSWGILRPSWSILEPASWFIMGPFWLILAPSCAILATILVHLGIILELFWAISGPYLGDSLRHLDKKVILSRLWALLAHQGSMFKNKISQGNFGPSCGHLEINCFVLSWPILGQYGRQRNL